MPLVIPSQGAAIIPQSGPMKLYIGSLHVNINEDMLRGIFEPFGSVRFLFKIIPGKYCSKMYFKKFLDRCDCFV